MSDGPALLRAIVASPEDVTVRLIYADWCEEHGRAAHAALIRGQCFLDPLLTPTPENELEYEDPDPRHLHVRRLSEEAQAAVMEPFAGLGVNARTIFEARRGFVERVALLGLGQLAEFAALAAVILDQTPLLTLRVWRSWGADDTPHLPADVLRTLGAVAEVRRVRSIDLSGYTLGEAGARALLKAVWTPESLMLSERRLSRATRDALSERFGSALSLNRSHASSTDDIPF